VFSGWAPGSGVRDARETHALPLSLVPGPYSLKHY
jgi:hypothetical protein